MATQLKLLEGGEGLEERDNRLLGELASLPGNGQLGLRANLVTSKNVGDLAMVFRLSGGDGAPFLLFGDCKGGVFGYSLFTRREPSWNKAVLGLPGSGKSMLMNAFLLGNANFASQGFVLDKGNSFGPLFELLAADMPDEVAVMRLRGGDFRCNPFPLAWALQERERQEAAGTYRMALEGGDRPPCPVEDARLFFESWLDALVGQGNISLPAEKNRLDRALKGIHGEGGFFRDYENQCRAYGEGKRQGLPVKPPRPLSALLTHLRNEAPELVPVVELWTRPPRDQLFDSGTDSVAEARYIYFELSGLDDDPLLAVPFLAALMGSVWQRIEGSPVPAREEDCGDRRGLVVPGSSRLLPGGRGHVPHHPQIQRLRRAEHADAQGFQGWSSAQAPANDGRGIPLPGLCRADLHGAGPQAQPGTRAATREPPGR